MGEQRVHRGREVELYMQRNADRPVTIEEIDQELHWNRNSISGRLNNMLELYPEHMERIPNRRGVYRWNSVPKRVTGSSSTSTSPPALEVDEMLVSVVTRDPETGVVLVRDDATHQLFTLKPFKIK